MEAIRKTTLEVIIKACQRIIDLKTDHAGLKSLTEAEGVCLVITKTLYNELGAHVTPRLNYPILKVKEEFNKQWADYSGLEIYPVPHRSLEPREAYVMSGFKEMWVQGSYAHARWNYVEDLKAFCERKLALNH